MKKVKIFLTAMIAVALASPIWSQGKSPQKMGMQGMMGSQGMHKMMSQGMMGQMYGSMCPMMDGGHMQGFFLNQAEALGLSDAQIEQLQKIKTATQKVVIQREADLKIAKLELDELIGDPKAKRSNLEAKAKKVEELKSGIRLIQFKAELDARAVLTPEQLEKATSMKMHMQGMMQMDSSNKHGRCPMMGSKSNSKGDVSDHEKHHPEG
ncbi:MAG: Spy/CpxP family protein refolding chaperone [bacterium]